MNPPTHQPVTQERFNQVIIAHYNDKHDLHVQGWEIPMLLGVIDTAQQHPYYRGRRCSTTLAMKRWRSWCLTVMQEWGFTAEECRWLDEAEVDPSHPDQVQVPVCGEPPAFLSPEMRQAIASHDAQAKYKSGLGLMDAGKCPANAKFPPACMLCRFGHLTECHYPKTCEEARCSHYVAE